MPKKDRSKRAAPGAADAEPGGGRAGRARSDKHDTRSGKSGSARRLLWVGAAAVAIVLIILFGRPLLQRLGVGAAAGRPGVILITLDTTRADRLGCYGDENAATPNLDRLAREGVLFENARAQVPVTGPSHAGILTGTFPTAHGVLANLEKLPADGIATIAEVFRDNGYFTGAVIGAFVVGARFGFSRGFGRFEGDFPVQLSDQSDIPEKPAQAVIGSALRWLEMNRSRPTFLWIHLFDPHTPYAAPEPFGSRYRERPYDGEIAYVDHCIGRLLDGVRDLGLDRRTVISVVADHGESLGEHAEDTHGYFLYNSTLWVPLIFWAPGRIPESRRIAETVRTVDVMPTLLDLLGLECPASVQGVSLVGTWDGTKYPIPHPLPSFSLSDELNRVFGWSPMWALERDGTKYIRLPRPELYDLRNDPNELQDLAAERPGDVARLHTELSEMIQATHRESGGEAQAAIDPATLEQLMSLGYISAGGRSESIPFDADIGGMQDPKDRLDYWERFRRLTVLRTEGKLEETEALAREMIAEDPAPPVVHYWLGQALWYKSERTGDPTVMREAASHLKRAAEMEEYRVSCLVFIGIIHGMLNEMPQARAAFEEILRIDPDEPMAHFNLTRVYAELEDWEGAARSGERLLELAPTHPDAPAIRRLVQHAKRKLSAPQR